MISYEQLIIFIHAQPDEKPVDLYEGYEDQPTGCVLMHYAKAHSIEIDYPLGFHSINRNTHLDQFASKLMVRLATTAPRLGEARQTETYGNLKQRIKDNA